MKPALIFFGPKDRASAKYAVINNWGRVRTIHLKTSGLFLNSNMYLLYQNQLDQVDGSFFINRYAFYKNIELNE